MISHKNYIKLATNGIHDFEILYDHPSYPNGTILPILHAKRYIWILNALEKFNPAQKYKTNIVNIGCFPGSLDRIIKSIYKEKVNITGIGLSITDEFKNAYLDRVYEKILPVELDPLNPFSLKSKYPTSISMDDNSTDVIIAGEIFEHLYSPLHFIQEISRILKKDGLLILTTPNVCYIGSIFKLILGRSCHENLNTSHIFMNSEWRAHIRIYDRHELAFLLGKYRMIEQKTEFIDNSEDKYYSNFTIRLKMKILKLFYIFPRFRNNLCLLYRKI